METDMTIYLIEDNNSAVAQALRNFWKEREEKRKTWLKWKDEHLPHDVSLREWSDGRIAGFIFPSGIPKGWKNPDRFGLCWPRANSPILKTMPEDKVLKTAKEHLKEVGIDVPTMITEKDSNGKIFASWHIGPFNPVQFIWAGLDDDAPKGVATPNYENELQKGAERIRTGCVMEPPTDFDWQNLLPGCRVIPKYEWGYLFGKWQDNQKGNES